MGSPSDVPDETVEASGGDKRTRDLAPGATLGKYKLERVLGSGGMGIVWAAHDPDLERAVALKVLRYENASPELRSRLLREARAMARLKHPNVLTVYEVDSEGDRDFIAMELVDGASLDSWLATKPSREQIWQAMIAAGHGLAAAHRAGLVHRDFKPHNVLRSHDGRVLVTDFGLARGHGDEVPVASTTTAPAAPVSAALEETLAATGSGTGSSPGSLDAPLTQTGALLGTPAYMAPEQFLGAPSDRRTDQFAYCVTAWQLFTGDRPFRGDTLEELRKAASAGAENVKGSMPRAIRAVLARGLAPDPANRWPDMHALLAALERAHGRPRRLVSLGISLAAVGLSGALAVKLLREPEAPPAKATAYSTMCERAPEIELASAWSPEIRARWMKLFGDSPQTRYVAASFEDFAARWLADYRSACQRERSTLAMSQIVCLLGERDEVAGIVDVVPTVPVDVIDDAEIGGVLPRPQACGGDSPVAPPSEPDDAAKRAKIKQLRPKLIKSRFAPAREVFEEMPALVREAEAIGWEPIVAEAHQAFGIAALRAREEWEAVRDHFKIANEIARRTHHYHLEADTWLGLLAGEIDAASDPNSDRLFQEQIAQARLATKNAGSDPVFLARIIQMEGQLAHSRGRLDDALAKYEEASAMELAANDIAAGMRFANDAVEVLLQRNRPGDLDAAWAKLVATERLVTEKHLSRSKRWPLDMMMSLVARVRGDLATTHASIDRGDPPRAARDAKPITGRVVDAGGKGVAGATVIAWRGTVAGDAARIYGDPGFEGDRTTTAADGSFTLRAGPDHGVIAELGTQRSQPRAIGDSGAALELALAPTRTLAGTVASDDEVLTGVFVIAHYALGPRLAWELLAPASRTREYRLPGLPAGAATLRLDTYVDPNRPQRKLDFGPLREGAPLRWPVGPTLDVIVHGAADRRTNIWVLRGHPPRPKTRAELDQLTARLDQVVIHEALVVGIADQTAEAMQEYTLQARHARFLWNAPGEVTVCIAERAPDSPVTCQSRVLRAAPDAPVRDGRHVHAVVPIVFGKR